MNLLLDTHIGLWWINQNKGLPPQHQNLIAQTKNVYVSAISCWELTMLHQRQKIELAEPLQDWLHIPLNSSNYVHQYVR